MIILKCCPTSGAGGLGRIHYLVPLVSESLGLAAERSLSPEAAAVTVELLGARVEVRGALAVLSDVFMALRRTRSC
jgi:hypothetical protein